MKITTTTMFLWLCTIFGLAQNSPTFLGSYSYPVSSLCGNGNTEEVADFVLATSDGGYLMVGSYECGGPDWDGRVVKVNSTGTIVWYDLPGYTGFDVLRSAVEVSDGYVVAGEVEVSGRAYLWLLKYNLAGTQLIWEKQIPNFDSLLSVTAYTIVTSFSNSLMVGGARWQTNLSPPYGSTPNSEGRIWVFDQNGNVINSGVSSNGYAVLKIEKGSDNLSYYAFGEKYYSTQEDCWSGGGGPQWTIYDSHYFPSNNGTYGINYAGYFSDVVVDKFNSSIGLIWTNNYGGNTPDGFIDGIATPDGGFAVLGDTYCQSQFGQTGPNNVSANFPANKYWLLKGNSAGNIAWVKPVGGHPNSAVNYIPRGLSNTCDAKYLVLLDQYLFSTTPYGVRMEKHDVSNIIWSTIQTLPDGYTTDVERTYDNKFVALGNRYNPNSGNYDFKLCRWAADPNCANGCTNATPISCGLTVSGNTSTGTSSFSASNYTICSGFTTSNSFNANDKIYSINKSSSTGDLVVTLFSSVDHDIFLFSQCNGVPAGCVGRSTLPAANGLNQEVIRIPNAPSGTYYIVVDGYNTAQQGAFTLTATCGNLSCSGATPISCGQTLNNQSNASASNNVSTYCNQSQPGSGTGCTGKERVYSISVTQQQPVTINLTGIDSNENFELFLLNGCNKDVCIASSTNGYGVQEQISATLSPGTTYYIVVDGWRETQGNFNLSVNCCLTPTYSFNCGNIVYVQTGASNPLQYTFSSVGQNIATGYTWQVNNQNVSSATGNSFTYTFPSAGSYDICFPIIGTNGCVEYCCRKYCIAPPVNCETSVLYSFNGSQMVFNLQTGSQTSSASWAWDDNPSVIIGSGNQIAVPIPPQCTTRTISVKYFDVVSGCWRICCRTIYICNPFNCFNFAYSYNGNTGFVFTMDPSLSGATNITWTVDDHPGGALNIGNATTSQPYPVPSPCVNRTITLRYFYNGVWYICCRTIQLCNPFNCYNFTYSYNGNNGFVFTIDPSLSGATNITWTVDDHPGGALDIGNATTSQPYPVPSPCINRTITLRYFYNGVWYICCRTIQLCNPFNCGSITLNYVANQGYTFTLAQATGLQNISWQVDQTGQSLGNNISTSQPLPVPAPGNCVLRTVSVRYFDPTCNCWRICCLTFYHCNPNDCSATINPTYGQNGSTTLQVNAGYQQVQWFNGTTAIGSTNSLTTTFQPGSSPTIYVRYYDPASGCYYYCCRTLTIPLDPPPCQLTANFTYAVVGNSVTFTNTSSGSPAYTSSAWNFSNGNTVLTSSQAHPVQTLAPGTWNCCLTVSNSNCASQQKCESVVVGGSNNLPPWGNPTPTNLSATFRGNAKINGVIADAQDWIAAFDESGDLAGSAQIVVNQGLAYINLTIYGDDPSTSNIDEGINAGEKFRLALFDASANTVLQYPTSASPQLFSGWISNNGAPIPGYDNFSAVYNFTSGSFDYIPLVPGWNLISTDLIPIDSSISAVLSSLQPGNVQYVSGFDNGALTYDPQFPFLSTLHHFKRGFGYWVKVNDVDTLVIEGTPINPAYFKPMNINWNLIAYLPQQPQAPTTYLASYITNNSLEFVSGYEGGFQTYDPDVPPFVNTLQTMHNSKGYWARFNTNNPFGKGVEDREVQSGITNVFQFIGGNANLKVGEHIFIQNDEGKRYGTLKIVLPDGTIGIEPVYGDDPLTGLKEGPVPGEMLYFLHKGVFAEQSMVFNGNYEPVYPTLTFKLPISTLDDNFLKATPNPFNGNLEISYHLTAGNTYSLEVFDMMGRKMNTIENGEKAAGWYSIKWPGDQLPAGTYLLVFKELGVAKHYQKIIKQ